MTKEELYKEILEYTRGISVDFKYRLDKFFESNVCIPKGETLQVNFAGGWDDVITINHHCEYRIKPSEPVYEYLWYNADGDTKWMTLDEAKEFERPWFWAKETSRMRQ